MSGLWTFAGADTGAWRISRIIAVTGEPLTLASRLHIGLPGDTPDGEVAWTLRGAPSNMRYAARAELVQLQALQEPLGRPAATRAALIPIRKSAAWWNLAQDERLDIFVTQSQHNSIGMAYLPAVARKLFHARDFGEPFDFLTWFEFAPEQEAAFDDLVSRLRGSAEWRYIEHEMDIRLEWIAHA